MLTRKSAKTLILGSGQAKKKILRLLAKERLPAVKQKAGATKGNNSQLKETKK